MKHSKLDTLIDMIEAKLDGETFAKSEDVLLTKAVLEFILELAVEEKRKADNTIVASEEDVYQLTHDE